MYFLLTSSLVVHLERIKFTIYITENSLQISVLDYEGFAYLFSLQDCSFSCLVFKYRYSVVLSSQLPIYTFVLLAIKSGNALLALKAPNFVSSIRLSHAAMQKREGLANSTTKIWQLFAGQLQNWLSLDQLLQEWMHWDLSWLRLIISFCLIKLIKSSSSWLS